MSNARELAELGGAYSTGGYPHFKNRIINGAMMIDQRNAGASVTPASSTYLVDRFRVGLAGSTGSKYSFQQSSVAPTGFKNSLLATVVSAYSVGSSDIISLQQSIEGYNVSDLQWGTSNAQTVTLSFWVKSSVTGTFGGSFVCEGATSSYYPFTYTISTTDWEQKIITVTGPTTNAGYTNSSAGLVVYWSLGTGSTYTGTANSWGTTQYRNATGATSLVGTAGATFYITGVQLEKGSTATSFDYRPYGTELALCQRYAYFVGAFMATHYTPSSSVYAGIPFTMRATPSVTMLGTLQMNNMIGNNLNLNGANFERGNQGGASIYLGYTGSSGASSAQACVVRPSSADAYSGVLFTAEL